MEKELDYPYDIKPKNKRERAEIQKCIRFKPKLRILIDSMKKLHDKVNPFPEPYNAYSIKYNTINNIKELNIQEILESVAPAKMSEELMECKVCYTKAKDTVLIPCGHTICSECIPKLVNENCPICRTPFTSTTPFYLGGSKKVSQELKKLAKKKKISLTYMRGGKRYKKTEKMLYRQLG